MNEKCYFYDVLYTGKVWSEKISRSVDKLRDNFIVLPDEDDDI